MTSTSDTSLRSPARRSVLAMAAAMAAGGWTHAALAADARRPALPSAVLPFDTHTWQQLLAKGARPTAYLFTASYCPNCPGAFDRLAAHIQSSHQKAELVVVMIDVQGAAALRYARHYAGATRLYSFDGFEPAIRQSVDPQWPNVTPYVVLVDKDGALRRCVGAPEDDALRQWLS